MPAGRHCRGVAAPLATDESLLWRFDDIAILIATPASIGVGHGTARTRLSNIWTGGTSTSVPRLFEESSQVKLSLFVENIIKQNWNRLLFVVKVTSLKQQISNSYSQIQRTDASDHIYVSHWPVVKKI